MDRPSISSRSSSITNSSAASALSQEIVECTQAEEILEVVAEEAELLTGPAAVLAMHQLALPALGRRSLLPLCLFFQMRKGSYMSPPRQQPRGISQSIPFKTVFTGRRFCVSLSLSAADNLICGMPGPAGGGASALEFGKAQTE